MNGGVAGDEGSVVAQEGEVTVEANGQLQMARDGGEDSRFQMAIAAWRGIELNVLTPKLDGVASELVNQQRDALTQRKDLAQKTKDFRRLDDTAKLSEIKGLLKAYQGFIDVLTTQSKSVSSAFFQLYTPLSEAPDPYPLLEASVDALITTEETVPRITSENVRLFNTVKSLTKQLEDGEALLVQEREARQEIEKSQETSTQKIRDSWSAVLKEKEDNWQAKGRVLEDKVNGQERLINDLKASIEVSQRLDRDSEPVDSRAVASSAELEIVSSELERANVRLAEVEARNEQLRLELAQSTSQTKSQASTAEDDSLLRKMQSEKSSLLRSLENMKLAQQAERDKSLAKSRGLERDLQLLRTERDAMSQKVQRWSDYDIVKQELDVLKAIELADDDDRELQNDASGKESLEQLLLARNKKLNNELTLMRVSSQDLQDRFQQLQESLSDAKTELEAAKTLNSSLEADLELVNSNRPVGPAMSVAGVSRYQPSVLGTVRPGRTSPTSSIISGMDSSGRFNEPSQSSGILPMVTAQRDRFRKRNSELESELSKAHHNVSSLRSEIASLQRDNLNLYEKTRYVSTFNRQSHGHAQSISTSTDSPSGLTLDRYKSTYEQNLSPFAAFRGKESSRAFRRLSLPERVVYQITRMVLATRTSRNLFAAYCLALHLLVLGMLYWIGASDIERQASNLGDSTVNSAAAGGAGDLSVADLPGAEDAATDWVEEGFSGT